MQLWILAPMDTKKNPFCIRELKAGLRMAARQAACDRGESNAGRSNWDWRSKMMTGPKSGSLRTMETSRLS